MVSCCVVAVVVSWEPGRRVAPCHRYLALHGLSSDQAIETDGDGDGNGCNSTHARSRYVPKLRCLRPLNSIIPGVVLASYVASYALTRPTLTPLALTVVLCVSALIDVRPLALAVRATYS